MRTLVMPLAALLLCACQSNPSLYQWGGYEPMLYQGYKDPANMEVMKAKLQDHIAAMEKSNQKVAPGLYAELGTLYLQGGAQDKAIALYERERDTWPESRGLMTAMIQNLERRKLAQSEVAK